MQREKLNLKDSKKVRVPMRGTGAEHFVVVMRPCNGGGAKGMRHLASLIGQPYYGMSQ